jgi:hypothetical protein
VNNFLVIFYFILFSCLGSTRRARPSVAVVASKQTSRRAAGGESAGSRAGAAERHPQWVVEETEEDSASTWAIMLDIWPLEDRPPKMTNPQIVNKLSFDQVIKYKKNYEALMKKEGKGDGVFGKDSTLPTKKFAAADDNCVELLHPAR